MKAHKLSTPDSARRIALALLSEHSEAVIIGFATQTGRIHLVRSGTESLCPTLQQVIQRTPLHERPPGDWAEFDPPAK